MGRKSEPSGIDSVGPPPLGSSPADIAEHYLRGYEEQFKKARRTVKRRASGVTIAASILTGVVAALGSLSAVLASDWISGGLAVLTTITSAAIAVLLAWNEHFHHRELWIQRSAILAEINEQRREFTARRTLRWPARRSLRVESHSAMEQLTETLRRDLVEWTTIQGR